jgi:hypothetical protein
MDVLLAGTFALTSLSFILAIAAFLLTGEEWRYMKYLLIISAVAVMTANISYINSMATSTIETDTFTNITTNITNSTTYYIIPSGATTTISTMIVVMTWILITLVGIMILLFAKWALEQAGTLNKRTNINER